MTEQLTPDEQIEILRESVDFDDPALAQLIGLYESQLKELKGELEISKQYGRDLAKTLEAADTKAGDLDTQLKEKDGALLAAWEVLGHIMNIEPIPTPDEALEVACKMASDAYEAITQQAQAYREKVRAEAIEECVEAVYSVPCVWGEGIRACCATQQKVAEALQSLLTKKEGNTNV